MAEPQKIDLALRGLFTAPNSLSGVPAGALSIADDIVINAKNLGESRRGQTQYGDPLSDEASKLFNYASSLIVNYSNKLAYDAGSGVWTDFTGTYNPPSSTRKMRSLEALRNFYFTTDKGIYKIDALGGTPRTAGAPKALGGEGLTTGASGFLLNDSAVAYRLVWGYNDANGNLILGSPSARLIVSNSTGGTRDVALEFPIPDGLTTSWFYQIYRSTGTATATDEPSDELQLVLQANITAAEITAKSFSVTDSTPYSLMRATLYTSPSQEGIANSNDQPPFAIDMDVFKGSAFYANVKQKQRLSLALISVDSPSLTYITEATAVTTSGLAVVTGITTGDLRVGMRVVGTGIQSDSRILSIDGPGQITMTKTATATSAPTVSLEFQDRFSVGGVDYWAGSVEFISTNTFLLYNSSTPGTNINETAINLVRVVNQSSSNTTVYAYYVSGLEDLPGQMLFEERAIGGSEFSATSTSGTSFSPALPDITPITGISIANPTVITSTAHGLTTGNSITIYSSNSTPTVDGAQTVTVINADSFTVPVNVTSAGTSAYFVRTSSIVSSDSETRQNRVFISKQGQVEAVPVYAYLDIGAANFPIDRVVALRDGIFFFKQDGVFRVAGENFSSFTVTPIDTTVSLLAPESAVAFNNQVFCFTTQGIVAVTDAGVQIMSVPIENVLLELSSDQFTNFESASFGVAYESARLYLFFTVENEDDTYARQAYVYNSLTDSWSRWRMNRTCGIVNPTVNKLFMGEPDTGQVLIERKSYTNADYADKQYAVTIASVDSDTEITLVSATNVEVGMTILQQGRSTLIEEIDGLVLTVLDATGFTAAAATVYTPILNKVQWAPIDVENPAMLKQFSEVTFMFKNAAFQEIIAGFGSNISSGIFEVPCLNNTGNAQWGGFEWGLQPWGGVFGGANVLRTYVPQEKQMANWLTISLETNEAFTGFALQGLSLNYTGLSTWVK